MARTTYVWDSLSDSYLLETDGVGTTTAVYTQEPSMFGGLISQEVSGQTSYFHYDNLGSTRYLTDDTQTPYSSFAYDSWGNQISADDSTAFRWNGRLGYYFDLELDTLHVRRRTYSSPGGRWTSPDPMLFVNSLVLYGYCANLPAGLNDPSGLIFEGETEQGAGAGCLGKPKGVVRALGRGTFTGGMSAMTPTAWFDFQWGSNFWLIFETPQDRNGRNGFTRKCCCCDEIAFIQTVRSQFKTTTTATNLLYWLTDPATIPPGRWTVDGGLVPYGRFYGAYNEEYATPGRPCKPNPQSYAKMGDTPHVSVIGLPTIYRFEAEVCAVCMSGNEGIDYGLDLESTTVPTPAGIAPSISTTIKGVTVYGCVKWGHDMIKGTRWGPDNAEGANPLQNSFEWSGFSGGGPSQDWVNTVTGWVGR
ncbi:MAG: RHS repeat-associated core domain-containing protein [Planctomycetota bacterium]